MKKYLSFLFFTSLLLAQAQYDKNVEEHQVQIGLPMPAILYEKGVAKNLTLSLELLTGFEFDSCISCTSSEEFGFYFIVRGQYRYYYNMKRRLDKGKNISGNSGNYVGGLLVYQDGNPFIGGLKEERYTLGAGLVYGLQRIYKRGFFYRLETGVAYAESDLTYGVGVVLAARIGWVLGKKR